MELLIVTGMSGAGKSQVVDALEDVGYYCVDNVPPYLLSKFATLGEQGGGSIQRIALVVDVRSRGMFSDFRACLDELRENAHGYRILFLECEDGVLVRRYKETRRKHPLLGDNTVSVENAIREERVLLSTARSRADYVIDTTLMSAAELRAKVRESFTGGLENGMVISCVSFGFKYGLPVDSDLVFDVRCLPNPYYEVALREKTGLDKAVSDYVMSFDQAKNLVPKLLGLIDYLIPLYIQEGKSQLVLSIGCTGGKHRSVTFAELLAAHLKAANYFVNITHRDIIK